MTDSAGKQTKAWLLPLGAWLVIVVAWLITLHLRFRHINSFAQRHALPLVGRFPLERWIIVTAVIVVCGAVVLRINRARRMSPDSRYWSAFAVGMAWVVCVLVLFLHIFIYYMKFIWHSPST